MIEKKKSILPKLLKALKEVGLYLQGSKKLKNAEQAIKEL